MPRFTHRDFIWLAVLLVPSIGWWHERWEHENLQRQSKATQTDLAVALHQQAQLAGQMAQRLDEYENQYALMRRLLRLAQQTGK